MHRTRSTAMLLVAASLAVLVSGCVLNHGLRMSRLPPAQNGQGVHVTASLPGRAQLRGELLELRDTSVVIATMNGLREVSLRSIRVLNASGWSVNVARMSADQSERVRLLSRFPYGMQPDVLQRLLAGYEQTTLPYVDRRDDEDDAELAAFVAAARAGTAAYHDRAAAIADGYRKIGPDSPAMGEHWINPGLVTTARLDAARPQILSYVLVHGTPRLTGVAYALPLRPGEAPPAGAIPCSAWHAHTGTVADEAMSLHSAGLNGAGDAHGHECGGGSGSADAPLAPPVHEHDDRGDQSRGHQPQAHAARGAVRLATVHAWVWLDNPDGVFAPDNWAIPFLRAGVDPGGDASPAAGRALALALGDTPYFMALLRRHAVLDDRDAARAERVLKGAGARLASTLERGLPAAVAEEEWARVWRNVEGQVSAGRRADVRRVRAALGG